MEAIKYLVLNSSGKEVGTIELDPTVFGAPVDNGLTHEVVTWQRNKKRAGTHSCLSKGIMRGGNRKPWRQKGTGRARAGSNTSPLWVGGAVAHGPKPHDYETRVSKRARRQALTAVLSDKVNSKTLVVLDALKVASGKTREVQSILKNIGVTGSALILLPGSKKEVQASPEWRASRNICGVETLPSEALNAYDLLRSKYLISTVDGVTALQKLLKGRMQSKSSKTSEVK